MITFVVGIYKSGTSLVTSTLEEVFNLKSVVEDFRKDSNVVGVKTTYNIRESYEVNLLNNDIIYSSNQNEMYFDTNNMPSDISSDLKYRIQLFYERIEYDGVIKDPRFIGTLKYWIKELPSDVKYKIVWVNRSNVDDIELSFKKDKWFVNKINGRYASVIQNLQNNLQKQFQITNQGIWIDYEFMIKYKKETIMCLFDYLNSDTDLYKIEKIYFADYFLPAKQMKELFSTQVPQSVASWKNLIAVNTQDEADYIIVQDKTNEIVDEAKVIFFGREPKHVPGGYRDWSDRKCFSKYHHELGTSWLPQTWWIKREYDDLITLYPEKTKNISIIDSGKTLTEYHSFRVNLINTILSNYENKVDCYGSINGNTLPTRDKINGLLNYKYNLAIENGRTDYYFSEKFCDPILCLTMPIYSGCVQIDKFFPKGSYIEIDHSKSNNYNAQKIIEISESSYRDDNFQNLLEARDLILKKYNIWNTVFLAINEGKIL